MTVRLQPLLILYGFSWLSFYGRSKMEMVNGFFMLHKWSWWNKPILVYCIAPRTPCMHIVCYIFIDYMIFFLYLFLFFFFNIYLLKIFVSLVEYSDVNAYRLSLSEDTKALNQLVYSSVFLLSSESKDVLWLLLYFCF